MTVSILAGGQLLLADTVFLIYAVAVEWKLPPAAISAWLAATVAQVIAVLLVLANNLFPKREGERLPDALVGPAGQEPRAPPVIALPPPPASQASIASSSDGAGGQSSTAKAEAQVPDEGSNAAGS